MRNSVIYFSKPYLTTQFGEKYSSFQEDGIKFIFSISENEAISLNKSPFGSFWGKEPLSFDEFETIFQKLTRHLKELGIEKLTVKHPASIYSQFVPFEFLVNVGFNEVYKDINQHICLNEWKKEQLHKMEVRKLKSLQNQEFFFQKIDDLSLAHCLIAQCREEKGLKINISLTQLMKLQEKTQMYECFGIYKNKELVSVCITALVNEQIAYYYLPATLSAYKKDSPMVLLVTKMCEYYQQKGYKYFDLGVSSIDGNPQDGLRKFKNRMGAKELDKYYLEYFIQS